MDVIFKFEVNCCNNLLLTLIKKFAEFDLDCDFDYKLQHDEKGKAVVASNLDVDAVSDVPDSSGPIGLSVALDVPVDVYDANDRFKALEEEADKEKKLVKESTALMRRELEIKRYNNLLKIIQVNTKI